MNIMGKFCSIAILIAHLGLQKPREEMDARNPRILVFPPPVLVDVNARGGKLTVKFREFGLTRIPKYRIYLFKEARWQLLGYTSSSPFVLRSCRKETTFYGIAAVDRSSTEGSRTKFSSDYRCSKLARK
jgi:hypothetical protein